MSHVGFGRKCLAVALLVLLAPYGSLGLLAQGQRAGQVAATIPAGQIERPSGSQAASTGLAVEWDDLVTTNPQGRIRLGLDDGSILNIGSNASLRVVRHDAASQQTNLTLTFGQMRARTRLTRPGGSFEVRTNTAVLGVIGTDFWVEAQPTLTRVIVFEGALRVTSLAGAAVMVGAGQVVSVPTSAPPSAPASATHGEMSEAASNTDVGSPQLPQPPAPRPPAAHKALPWILAAAAAAAVTIVAIIVANDDNSPSSSPPSHID